GGVTVAAEVKAPSSLPGIDVPNDDLDAQIWSFAIGGAVTGGVSVAGSGSLSLNWVRNTIDAHISDAAVDAGGAVSVSAADHATIDALAGAATSAGGLAVGVSVANNYVGGDPSDPGAETRN